MQMLVDIHTHHPRPGVLSPTMAGIHPWDAESHAPLPDLTTCDIIGETGLDGVCGVDLGLQEQLFREHLRTAEALKKPVVLHVVRCFERVMQILADYALQGVVFHGFIGSLEQAARATSKGYYLSYGYRSLRSKRTLEALKSTPLDNLFVESDDDPNTDLERLYSVVAEIKQIGIEELKTEILKNYKQLINR